MMETLVLTVLLVIAVVAILAFFMPIFVYQMRNDLREIKRLVGKMAGEAPIPNPEVPPYPSLDEIIKRKKVREPMSQRAKLILWASLAVIGIAIIILIAIAVVR